MGVYRLIGGLAGICSLCPAAGVEYRCLGRQCRGTGEDRRPAPGGLARNSRLQARLETAYCSTLRLKLLKIGARVRITSRKVWVSLASSCPDQDLFDHAWNQLQRAGPTNV